jgi:hypothetical protein
MKQAGILLLLLNISCFPISSIQIDAKKIVQVLKVKPKESKLP